MSLWLRSILCWDLLDAIDYHHILWSLGLF
jgi:hypothetical protein